MMDYNYKDLVRIPTKICTNNSLWIPYKCTEFQLGWSTRLYVEAIFSSVQKDKKKNKNKEKLKSLLTHISETLRTIFF